MSEEEPYGQATVRRLCRAIVAHGSILFSDHAVEQMEERAIEEVDVKNVIRGGYFDGVDFELGTWRYRIRTPKLTVVVAFRSESKLSVVTTWRNE